MGVDARLTVYAKDQKAAEDACRAAFERVAALDTIMSDYRINSELNLLCAQAGGPAVKVSADLFAVFEKAQRLSGLTDGLFDISASPVIRLWRTARKSGTLPAPEALSAAKALVNYRWIHLDRKSRSVRLEKKGMQLDLGGIGKGYADDAAMNVLRKHGIRSAMIEMGGDILVSNAPPGRPGWAIDVPNATGQKGPLILKNCAISSSGDTEQFVVIDGKKYSHVVNPRTGLGLSEGVQATVITRCAVDSDALSTAMTLVDEKERKRISSAYRGTKVYVRRLPFSG